MQAVHRLLSRAIDYAGLFPPAKLPLSVAATNYSKYRRSEHSWMLGRFIVPVTRLGELEAVTSELIPHDDDAPWDLAVLDGGDPKATAAAIRSFEMRHGGRVLRIGAVELKVERPPEVTAALEILPHDVELFFEPPSGEDPRPFLSQLPGTRGRGKVRTGGVSQDAFPTTSRLARFLSICDEEDVPFKATAGLHHAVCGTYALTYERNSQSGEMFGFLNVLLAAAMLRAGKVEGGDFFDLLEEDDPEELFFERSGITWRGHRLTLEELSLARSRLLLSFGSCSFDDPLSELKELALL